MLISTRWIPSILLMALLVPAIPAAAQDNAKRPRQPGIGRMMNFEIMAENYARLLARRYNLDDAQDEFTQELLRERTRQFLDKHEEQLRDLVDEMFAARTGADFSQQDLIAWGKLALPMYLEAKEFIVAGNEEWREILNDEQHKLHDEDLKLMWQSFETTDDQIERIVSGQMTLEEFRNPPRPARPKPKSSPRVAQQAQRIERPVQEPTRPPPRESTPPAVARAEPPVKSPIRGTARRPVAREETIATSPKTADNRPKRPTPRPPRRKPGSSKSGQDYESKWDKYTNDFIAKYQLNDDQKQKALTILKDCKEQARQYVQKKKAQIEKLDKESAKLKSAKSADARKKLAEITSARAKLLAPVEKIFETNLKPRLEKLPSRAQRRAAEAASKKPATKTPRKTGRSSKP